MKKPSKEIWIGALIGASLAGAAGFGWMAILSFAIVGFIFGGVRGQQLLKPESGGSALQNAADEARSDELRLVVNYLHASGIPAWREAACELDNLGHRVDADPC